MGKKKETTILTKGKKPEKKLMITLKSKSGRNNAGRITVRHRGGGVKRCYRMIDFGQGLAGIEGKIVSLEYDPYRTSYIMLVEYISEKGILEKRYRIAAQGLKVGDKIIIDPDSTELKTGNRLKLKNIAIGTDVYDVELHRGRGGQIVRSAGSSAKVVALEGKYTHLKMPSKEIRKVLGECYASIGVVSNIEHQYRKIGKAGIKRRKGWRPTVRGSAMNPIDHPHGGGEGRTGIGMPYPKTPTGKHAMGVKTRKRKKPSNQFIIQRRVKKKRKK